MQFSCITVGILLAIFGAKTVGAYYPNGYCAAIGTCCGTYTSCAQFIGSCTDPTSNEIYNYQSLVNQNANGGFCATTGGE